MYKVSKKFPHSEGLSVCFRQWHATFSHCRFLHGYSLSVEVIFEGHKLDPRNWLVNFGGFGDFKEWLHENFDHTTLIAEDDPELPLFKQLDKAGIIQLKVLPKVGCEAFAEYIHNYLANPEVYYWRPGIADRTFLTVVVGEHEGNHASFRGEVNVEQNRKDTK